MSGPDPEPLDRDAVGLSRAIAAREVSCVEVMRAHLDAVARRNPGVTALVGLRDGGELLAEAAERDAELARCGPRGPLHGFPHAVKDLTEARGLPWTAGSPVHAERVGATDAEPVRRLRAAGAVLVGKSNVPEFGFGSQTYNPVWGATGNAYDPSRTAGGSSGGAAVALALRLVPLADGSDYMGSLRNPAAFNNVLGLRPSLGRVPKPGFLPQLGEIGPMARTVDDLALLLDVLSGPDPRAPLARPDRVRVRRRDDLRGVRVGVLGDLGGHLAVEPGLLDLAEGAAGVLAGAGAAVEPVSPAFDLERLWRAFLAWRGWAALDLAGLHADAAARARLKPEVRWEIEQGLRLTPLDLRDAAATRDAWFETVAGLFDRYDVLLAPSAQVFPFPVEQAWPREVAGRPMDTYHRWMETVAPWSMAATPVLNLPAGFDAPGRPAGVQLVAPPGAEARLLEIGRVYEAATGWVERVRPPALG